VALEGNPADFRPVPWLYYPLLTAPFGNPITRNLNMISIQFAGTIDTIGARTGIKKTVLLRSSQYSRQVKAPVIISLDEIQMTPRQEQFSERFQPVAVLLEGKFESAFRNRMTQHLFPDTVVKVKESGEKSAMLIVSDGDLIRNDIQPTPQGVRISPLGLDRYSKQTYGNKEFIVNAIQYLTGHQGLISLRSRQLTLRLLDKNKITRDRTQWILINLAGPPLVIIILGILYTWLRKRRFTGG
jgi:gliding-associated putative ABC transporter substrate-binding component GldG